MSRSLHKVLAASILCLSAASQLPAQESPQVVTKPSVPILIRPYLPTNIPPVRLTNSGRLNALIRGGKLYLTVQDAIELAVENNLDLEVDRYGPLTAEWNLKRAEAGGPLRGVTQQNIAQNEVTGGQGVLGSEQTTGLLQNTIGGSISNQSGTVSQLGPVTPNLDPDFQNATAFQHLVNPQFNSVVSQTNVLIQDRHFSNSFVQEGLITGGTVQVTANESYLKENAPSDYLNPSVFPQVAITVRQQFAQGFGIAVNRRFIKAGELGVKAARESYRSQMLNTVASVLNLYWNLVAADDELRVRQRALEAAQKFLDDTKKQIELGAEARADIYRAESDAATRGQELAIAQVSVQQQESLLKNAISLNGTADPLIDAVAIVPLDHAEVPASEELPGLRDLLARALAKRPDIILNKINDETQEVLALGTINTLLPNLGTRLSTSDVGQAGASVPGGGASNYYVGGLGTALGQVFRRNFYNQSAAVGFSIPFENRQAQGDFGIDQLAIRQGDLVERRSMNQIVVDISNDVIALRQARARYTQAVDSRALQEQLLDKEQQMFSFGAAQISDVVGARSALLGSQIAETQARAAYARARVALDQVLGETLEKNHVSLDEGLNGRVKRESRLPTQ
ncbi:MAG: TolC family protein [Bryobacteraceae bacterium]|jgi:outer membrane protein TolC